MTRYGGIEAGGTKFVCAVGSGPAAIEDEIRFPTRSPAETLPIVVDFFRRHAQAAPLAGLGIASFGPVDPNPRSPTFGQILATTKPGWSNIDMVGHLQNELALPVGFDTDVNGAALAESIWGAGQGCDSLVYLTVGTGIGGGAVVQGRLLHGALHPEMGHMRIPHDRTVDPFAGVCRFHADCWEGLACGPAIEARWQRPASELPPDHPAWTLEVTYLVHGLMNIVMALSPQRIVMGGGVMDQRHLFPRLRTGLVDQLNGYIRIPAVLDASDDYIVPPHLGAQAGVLGAIALAQQAATAG